MWQRIQTVFLLVAIVSLLIAIFLPIWVLRDTYPHHELYALHYSQVNEDGSKIPTYLPYSLTAILFIASITIMFIEISKFRDRLLQIKLGALNSLLLAIGLGTAVYFGTSLMKLNGGGGQLGLGLWAPSVAVVCNWLAMRFIRRDEKMVRDSNRLR